jgi:hypothetical protein
MINLLEYKKQEDLYVIHIPLLDSIHTEFFIKIPWSDFKKIKYSLDFGSVSLEEVKNYVIKHYTVKAHPYSDEEINHLYAGIVETVYEVIMYLSDPGILARSQDEFSLDKLNLKVEVARAKVAASVDIQMFTTICSVFRSYTFEMLKDFPFDKICELFAAAEQHMLATGVLSEPMKFYQNLPSQEGSEMKTAMGAIDKRNKEIKKSIPQDDTDTLFETLKKEVQEKEKSKPQEPTETKPQDNVVAVITREDIPVNIPARKKQTATPHNSDIPDYSHNLMMMGYSGDTLEKEIHKLKEFVKGVYNNIKPMKVSESHPRYKEITEREQQRSQQLRDINIEKYLSNLRNGTTFVTDGFKPDDFEGVALTDEEAYAEAIASDVKPAGYEIIEREKQMIKKMKEDQEQEEVRKIFQGRKILNAKEIKKLKDLKNRKK